jgi:glycosyltransferase involved in cell wall biosynthesis
MDLSPAEQFLSFLTQDPAPPDHESARRLFEWLKAEPGDTAGFLQGSIEALAERKGIQSALNVLSRIEVALGFRRPRLGLYDNALHFIGGAQKYGCTVAHALQDMFDITLIAHREVTLEQLQDWYGLDLSRCRIKVVSIPYFDQRGTGRGVFDAGLVDLRGDNPFHAVSWESGVYDVFFNNCMLEMVYPLAPVSVMMVHFPEREISRFFHVPHYDHVIYNSRYTAEWIRRRWRVDPHIHIYPPVDMASPLDSCLDEKEDVILSVARFEPGGNKQQLEMIKTFFHLVRHHHRDLQGWRLILAGGSIPDNPYLERIRNWLREPGLPPVELEVNLSADKLKRKYRSARLFWHFSGLGQRDPARIEHFGMTTVEAMQNACVPVVFNGGGQMEIVEDGMSGVLFESNQELERKFLALIKEPEKIRKLARGAHARGQNFTKDVFVSKVRQHFLDILREYRFADAE